MKGLKKKMFESTGWTLQEAEMNLEEENKILPMNIITPPRTQMYLENMNKVSEINLVQQYQFSSTLQRMSVIAHIPELNEFRAYTKGSPEMILSLSKPQSIPSETSNVLQSYTQQGYRVIAVGYSEIFENIRDVSY